MAVRQGRSERRGESYSVPYVEPLSDARTKLEDVFSILIDRNMVSEAIFPEGVRPITENGS